ncbi:MAG: DUF3313 domain-containing protein [Planctomycetota bacterium]
MIRILIPGVFLLAACGSTPELRRSGFLDDYSKLAPVEGSGGIWSYRSPDLDFEKYQALLVDPAVAWFNPDSEAEDIDPKERKRLTEELGRTIRNTLRDNGYRLAKEPGADVLRVRVAITDLYVRVGPLTTEGNRSGRIRLEGAALEADLKDSLSGRVLFAVMTTRRGGGVQTLAGSTNQRVFQYWGDQLVKLLEEPR